MFHDQESTETEHHTLIFSRSVSLDHAEAALLLQPAEGVVIGNPGGDAHSAGLGTGTPLCGLDQAVGSDHGWVWAKRVSPAGKL